MEYTVYKWSQSPFRPRSHKGIFYSLKFINLSKVTLLRATRVCNQEDLCMLMTSFSFNNFSSPGKRRWTTLWGLNTSLTKVISYYFIYPSFKIFLPFRLANVPRIIHHNQLSSGKFGRIMCYVKKGVKCAAKLPDYWTVNREDLGTRLSCFWQRVQKGGTFHSFHEEKIGELLAKNITRTARRQLDRWHLLFGEYLHTWTTLYLLNLPINMHYRRWT